MRKFKKHYNFNIKIIFFIVSVTFIFTTIVHSCPISRGSLRVPFLFQDTSKKEIKDKPNAFIINGKKLSPLIAPTAITHRFESDDSSVACIRELAPNVACDLVIKSETQVFIFLPGDIEELKKNFTLSEAEELLQKAKFGKNSGFFKLGKEGSIPESMGIEYIELVQQALVELGETREFIAIGNTSKAKTQEEAIIMAGLWAGFLKMPYVKLEIRDQDLMTKNDEIIDTVERLIKLNKDIKILPLIGKGITKKMLKKLLNLNQVIALRIEGTQPGSGKGLGTEKEKDRIKKIITWVKEIKPDIPLIAECGIGMPEHAKEAMNMGFDAVLVNAAITESDTPVELAVEFAKAVNDATRVSQPHIWLKRENIDKFYTQFLKKNILSEILEKVNEAIRQGRTRKFFVGKYELLKLPSSNIVMAKITFPDLVKPRATTNAIEAGKSTLVKPSFLKVDQDDLLYDLDKIGLPYNFLVRHAPFCKDQFMFCNKKDKYIGFVPLMIMYVLGKINPDIRCYHQSSGAGATDPTFPHYSFFFKIDMNDIKNPVVENELFNTSIDLSAPILSLPTKKMQDYPNLPINMLPNYPGANFIIEGEDIVKNIFITLFIIRLLDELKLSYNFIYADGRYYIFVKSTQYGGEGIFSTLKVGILETIGYFVLDGRSCKEIEESLVRDRMNLEFNSLDGHMYEEILKDILSKEKDLEFVYKRLKKLDQWFAVLESLNLAPVEEILSRLSPILSDRKNNISAFIESLPIDKNLISELLGDKLLDQVRAIDFYL